MNGMIIIPTWKDKNSKNRNSDVIFRNVGIAMMIKKVFYSMLLKDFNDVYEGQRDSTDP